MTDTIEAEGSDSPFAQYEESPGYIKILGVIIAAFVIYAAYTIELNAFESRATFLMLIVLYVFLRFPLVTTIERSLSRWTRVALVGIDAILVLATLVAYGYLIVNSEILLGRVGIVTEPEIALGFVAVAVVLEATRRTIGYIIPILVLVSTLYVFMGQELSGILSHPGFSSGRFVIQQYLTKRGLFSFPLKVSLDYIYLFVLFGAVLEFSGGGKAFLDLTKRMVGGLTGGPAKLAVISSGLMGMLSGSTTANVLTTGSVTIPTMKQQGYKSEFAGAVESAASTGGQLTPPVMGVAVFIMVQLTGISYLFIITHAVLPAVLFFFGIFMAVHFQSEKKNLAGLAEDEIPSRQSVVRRLWYFIPVIGIVILLYLDYSVQMTILWATVLLVGMTFLSSSARLYDPRRDKLSTSPLMKSIDTTASRAAPVIAAATAIGILLGNIGLTGIGIKIAGVITALGEGNLLLALLLAALLCLIFGTTMTTITVYILLAVLVAPGLVDLGIDLFSAHMFIFYYGMLAMVTPPVCLAAYAAATIAESDPIKTGVQASMLSVPAYLLPFVFVYDPALLLIGPLPKLVLATVTGLFATVAFAAAIIGYITVPLTRIQRVLFMIAAVLLMIVGWETDLVGGIIAVVMLARSYPIVQRVNNFYKAS